MRKGRAGGWGEMGLDKRSMICAPGERFVTVASTVYRFKFDIVHTIKRWTGNDTCFCEL